MIHKNRGMFLESIINSTINFLNSNNIALFYKKEIPIKFSEVIKQDNKLRLKNAYITKKSTSDYYGIYKGVFVAFEAKSTNLNYFLISNIKKHQQNYLIKIKQLGGISFYIICFKSTNSFFILEPDKIKKDIKKIEQSFFIKKCFTLNLEYPGLLTITNYLDQNISLKII